MSNPFQQQQQQQSFGQSAPFQQPFQQPGMFQHPVPQQQQPPPIQASSLPPGATLYMTNQVYRENAAHATYNQPGQLQQPAQQHGGAMMPYQPAMTAVAPMQQQPTQSQPSMAFQQQQPLQAQPSMSFQQQQPQSASWQQQQQTFQQQTYQEHQHQQVQQQPMAYAPAPSTMAMMPMQVQQQPPSTSTMMMMAQPQQYQQVQQQHHQQFYQASSAAYAGSNSTMQQQPQQWQQQQQVQHHHQQYASSTSTNMGQPQVGVYQQQQQQQQQQYYASSSSTNMNLQQQPPSQPLLVIQAPPQPQQVYQQVAPQHAPVPYEVIEPVATAPQQQPRAYIEQTPTALATSKNLLSHTDSSLLLQEAFLVAGAVHALSGRVNPLDLQGIWAKVRTVPGNPHAGEQMKLSLRMANQSTDGSSITDLRFSFEKNGFGLVLDPSIELLPSGAGLAPGQTHTAIATLFCSPENQHISSSDDELTAVTIAIQFTLTTASQQSMDFRVATNVPLHIFFTNHPQNPSAAHESLLPISASDEGPRMTQSAYLSAYQSPDAGTTRQFSVAPGIPWQRWYNHAAASGVLDALTGSKGAPVSPSDLANGVVPPSSQVIKVIELKLSRNRVYVVAAREPALNNGPMSSMPSDLVFFISLRVGDGVNEDPAAGSLVMGELRFVANGTESGCGVWERCDVTLKSKMNARMWVGLERAISAVLRS